MYKEERKKYMENVLVIGAHPDDIEKVQVRKSFILL